MAENYNINENEGCKVCPVRQTCDDGHPDCGTCIYDGTIPPVWDREPCNSCLNVVKCGYQGEDDAD